MGACCDMRALAGMGSVNPSAPTGTPAGDEHDGCECCCVEGDEPISPLVIGLGLALVAMAFLAYENRRV